MEDSKDSTEHTWEALPQRKRRTRTTVPERILQEPDADKRSRIEIQARGTSDKIDASITEAVRLRQQIHRAEATLQGGDGKAGEFYEYLDHTADVQLHAWGPNLRAAFENLIPCMFNYITDLSTVEVNAEAAIDLQVEGHDLMSLLFNFLDDFLFKFSTDMFVCKRCEILEFDTTTYRITARGHGEIYDMAKHPQGTEIKAITYSNMQIHDTEDKADLFVIVDI